VTSRVTHATPAAYYAHVPSRTQDNDIMEQGVYQNLDVVLGGGRRHLLPKE
jgi:alkaline phosphatase